MIPYTTFVSFGLVSVFNHFVQMLFWMLLLFQKLQGNSSTIDYSYQSGFFSLSSSLNFDGLMKFEIVSRLDLIPSPSQVVSFKTQNWQF